MTHPKKLITQNRNATVAGVAGASVIVVSVLADDAFGYEPSSPAFWPAVGTLVSVIALAIGKRRKA